MLKKKFRKWKIGYFADGPWSYRALDKLIADPSLSIEFIVPRADMPDQVLLEYANTHSIDALYPVKINTQSFIEQAKSYDCDLFVSMSFNQIFKEPLINLPKYNTINCHAGKLPFYRGRNVLNWVLINDEKEFGITVHFMDEGIDTGDIILQTSYSILESDNYATLLEKAYFGCAELLYKAIKQIQSNTYKTIRQTDIHPIGLYCGKRIEGDEIINWNSTSRELFNFIRAICRPGPIAHTTCKGRTVKINQARYIENAPTYINTPGQVLKKTQEGFLVKTKDSFIEILDFESDKKICVGDRFGT